MEPFLNKNLNLCLEMTLHVLELIWILLLETQVGTKPQRQRRKAADGMQNDEKKSKQKPEIKYLKIWRRQKTA